MKHEKWVLSASRDANQQKKYWLGNVRAVVRKFHNKFMQKTSQSHGLTSTLCSSHQEFASVSNATVSAWWSKGGKDPLCNHCGAPLDPKKSKEEEFQTPPQPTTSTSIAIHAVATRERYTGGKITDVDLDRRHRCRKLLGKAHKQGCATIRELVTRRDNNSLTPASILYQANIQKNYGIELGDLNGYDYLDAMAISKGGHERDGTEAVPKAWFMRPKEHFRVSSTDPKAGHNPRNCENYALALRDVKKKNDELQQGQNDYPMDTTMRCMTSKRHLLVVELSSNVPKTKYEHNTIRSCSNRKCEQAIFPRETMLLCECSWYCWKCSSNQTLFPGVVHERKLEVKQPNWKNEWQNYSWSRWESNSWQSSSGSSSSTKWGH